MNINNITYRNYNDFYLMKISTLSTFKTSLNRDSLMQNTLTVEKRTMVEYTTKHKTVQNNALMTILSEADEYFVNKVGTTILGEGFKDIISDEDAFNKYVNKLTEDITDQTEADSLRILMENARLQTLTEASTSGIAPVASLTLPTLRVMWARTGLVHAVPTEPVKSNAFSVSYNRPCIVDEEGNKHYLPEALDMDAHLGDKKALEDGPIALPAEDHDLLGAVGCSKATGDSVDRNFAIVSATIDDKEYMVNIKEGKLDINDRVYLEVKDENGAVLDIVFAAVDLWNGILNATSMKGKVTSIKIRGFVASDAHNHATNITFEMVRRDFQIGTGDHFEAALPIEFLQDTMATYSIDGTTEVVDVMSNIVAQKLDMEIFNFVKQSYDSTNAKYYGEFDLRPASSYAGAPKDWREELKTIIDNLASTMKSDTHVYQGYFVLFGNPVDTQLLPNVNWTFNSTVDTQSGIEVSYSLGAMSGSNKYNIVSSDIIPRGAIYGLFVPTIQNYKTIVYYPYTFSVINQGYLNTRTPNVPSIMVTKRHTIEEFTPLVFKIDILNNTAMMLASLPR